MKATKVKFKITLMD